MHPNRVKRQQALHAVLNKSRYSKKRKGAPEDDELFVVSIRMPWSKMKPGDITNWPADLQVILVSRMNTLNYKGYINW